MSEAEKKSETAADAEEATCEAEEEPAAGESGGEEPESAPAAEEAKQEPPKKDEPDWKDMYARTLADFDNYRKRTARDREELVKFSNSEVIKDMIRTADDLAMALKQAADKEDPLVKGVKLAYDNFIKALKDHGAESFESVGEVLDPNRHEAITMQPSDAVEEGKITEEFKKGWMLNGRLLRAAQVVVSSGKAK